MAGFHGSLAEPTRRNFQKITCKEGRVGPVAWRPLLEVPPFKFKKSQTSEVICQEESRGKVRLAPQELF